MSPWLILSWKPLEAKSLGWTWAPMTPVVLSSTGLTACLPRCWLHSQATFDGLAPAAHRLRLQWREEREEERKMEVV